MQLKNNDRQLYYEILFCNTTHWLHLQLERVDEIR